jgi:hypothetical protein
MVRAASRPIPSAEPVTHTNAMPTILPAPSTVRSTDLSIGLPMSIDPATLFAAITAIGTLAVPVVVAVMANRFNDQVKRWEANQWRNQELIKARLEYYRQLVPQLNDLMCYFVYIGQWKHVTPPTILALKRTVDKEFYCSKPLFSDGVGTSYDEFMALCFKIFGGMGTDAKLRTGFDHRRKAMGPQWNSSWETMFTHETEREQIDRDNVRRAYDKLINAFADDIELTAANR